MNRIVLSSLLAAGAALAACGPAGEPVPFAGGFPGGSYYPIAQSLNKLPGYRFDVSTSNGSFDNISALDDGKAAYTLTQLDMLQSFGISEPGIKESVKIVMPLYTEEVHLLARRNIQTPADLAEKRVSFGHIDSGSKITSLIFLDQLNIGRSNITIVDMPSAKAVEELLAGKLDAVLIVVGRPAKILADIPASEKENIHLLAFTGQFYDKIEATNFVYQRSEIPAGTYPWQDEAVQTLGVQSVLAARGDIPAADVEKLARAVYAHRDDLASSHDKWQNLNKDDLKKLHERLPDAFHPGMQSFFQ